MKIKNNWIVVKELDLAEAKTESKLIIPASSDELEYKVKYGEVVKGHNKVIEKCYPVGCKIVFNKYYSLPFKADDKEYIAVPEKDIIAII